MYTKKLQIRFLVRAHAWVAGSIPGGEAYKKATNCSLLVMFLVIFSFSHPPPKAIKKCPQVRIKKKSEQIFWWVGTIPVFKVRIAVHDVIMAFIIHFYSRHFPRLTAVCLW